MKNRPRTSLLLLLAIIFSGSACVRRARIQSSTTANEQQSQTSLQVPTISQAQPQRININTASANELETLPGIGKSLAQRIIEHREKYGPFRRPEHLIILRGISDKRFRALRDLVTVK
jgi:competence protein ComEA